MLFIIQVKDLAERTLPDSHSLLRCGPEAKHDAKYYKVTMETVCISTLYLALMMVSSRSQTYLPEH